MASKQLGKLRQWAGEVISSKDKSVVTDEFKELENDVALRKEGLLRLHVASEAYHHSLSKKKDSIALDETKKLLPIDALGVVMIHHGEEFGEDSAFGTSLVKFGQAHAKVATLQEAYALTFQDTFVASIKDFGEKIKDFEHQRKKLDSRRLSYDAAISKLDKLKTSKKDKEKERKEAEDELQTARLRYEETSEDVSARALAIQDHEIDQLHELTAFLDLELNYAQQYVEVLQDVKSSWVHEDVVTRVDMPRSSGPTHVFSRTDDSVPTSKAAKKLNRNRSQNSVAAESSEDSDSDESIRVASRKSLSRRPSASGSKPPSRPASRASRKRADSGATAGGSEKEKEKVKSDKAGKRMSVAGWASSAVSSVAGLAGGKKDKENFANLSDSDNSDRDDKEYARARRSSTSSKKHSRTKSKDTTPNHSPQISAQVPRILKPPSLQGKKLVRALYDFSGSSDELSFKVGDEIVVLNEVLDGWWMGELHGEKGLFPTPYTEVVSASPSKLPSLPLRPAGSSISSASLDGYATSDFEDDHPFGDHLLVSAARTPTYGGFDVSSINDIATEEEEETKLMPIKPSSPESPPAQKTSPSIPPQLPKRVLDTTPKKIPPPPPPRRSTNNVLAPPPPPIPSRRPSAARSYSSGSLPRTSTSSSLSSFSGHGHGQDVSPFDSATEVKVGGCQSFRQNPFKPPGMCSNCLQVHG